MADRTVTVGGAKNGGSRVIPGNKAAKWYPAEDAPVAKKNRKAPRAPKLRASLVPGAVLILVAGRFRGKRVVLLKPLEDGTLLVTGPFKINGVPLRRVNPAYVIATSTKVDVSSVQTEKFTPSYFAREKSSSSKSKEAEFFGDNAAKKEIKQERVTDQKEVDKALLSVITKTPLLKAYLASSFSLKSGDRPHLMKF